MLYIFIGWRHFAVVRVRAGGGGRGILAGRDLAGLHQPGEHFHGLVQPPVSLVLVM